MSTAPGKINDTHMLVAADTMDIQHRPEQADDHAMWFIIGRTDEG